MDIFYLYAIEYQKWTGERKDGLIYVGKKDTGDRYIFLCSKFAEKYGGGLKQLVYLCKNKNKKLVVRKHANSKYIMVSKEKIYLNKLRGKYRYVK